MWKFIKYLIKSFAGCVSSAFGDVPEDFTWKEGITGVIVMLVLIAILAGVVLLIRFLAKR